MIIQIFEITNAKEAKKLAKLGVNHIGVVVGKGKISFSEAKKIFKEIRRKAKGVATSMSTELDEIFNVAKTKPDILNLGTPSEKLTISKIKTIKRKFSKLKIMITIYVVNKKSIEQAKKFEKVADYFLLDTIKGKKLGATGKPHNWNISKKIVKHSKVPVILAGGLGPDNVSKAIKIVKPAGIDSKTKTDKVNGKGKDLNKIKKFINIIRKTENELKKTKK